MSNEGLGYCVQGLKQKRASPCLSVTIHCCHQAATAKPDRCAVRTMVSEVWIGTGMEFD